MPTPLYLEDLAVGQRFESRPYLLTAEEIKAFARQYDPQYFHTDEEAARESFFKGLAASGWNTAALTMRLLVDTVPIAGGLIGAGVEHIRWFRPVRPGETLRAVFEVTSLRESKSKPFQGIIRLKHITLDEQDQPVQEFTSVVVVPKRPA